MCLIVKVKAVHANLLKQAESCWVFSGFPPSLILCSSPSGLGTGSNTQSGCWWRVGTCLDLLCCLSKAERDRHSQREEACDQQSACERWPTQKESPAAPMDRLLLVSAPGCSFRRGAWMEELHCCLAAWWVSQVCVNKTLWHIQLQNFCEYLNYLLRRKGALHTSTSNFKNINYSGEMKRCSNEAFRSF